MYTLAMNADRTSRVQIGDRFSTFINNYRPPPRHLDGFSPASLDSIKPGSIHQHITCLNVGLGASVGAGPPVAEERGSIDE